jgi:dipeptidyl-peptidase 4
VSRDHRAVILAAILSGAAMTLSGAGASAPPVNPDPAPGGISFQRVARFPPPGGRVANGFRFTRDGGILYFLQAEGNGVVQSLFREEVATGAHTTAARPPGTPQEGGLSREETLRRERKRLQEKGITQYVLAARADVVVFAYAGDLYLARPGHDPLRLTETPATELDPQLSEDGRRLGFVRDGDLYVMELPSRAERRLTEGARDGLTHGLAEYIAQEEMDRFSGFWWAPDGRRLAYTEVDETGIPVYPIVHQGSAEWEVERERYPFAGGPNARVRLGVVAAAGGPTRWLSIAPADGTEFYLARVTWDRQGSLLAQVESRDQTRLRLLRFDPDRWEPVTLLEDRSDTFINLHDDLHPLPGGRFLWSSERGGYRHLELRAPDGTLLRALTSGPWAVDALQGVDETKGTVFFTAAKDSPLERPLYRVPLEGGAIERVTPEDGFHTVTVSPDGRLMVDVHDSLRQPPRALLREASGRTLRVLDPNDDPEPAALGLHPPEMVTLPAGDGTTLYGALYRPPGPVPAGGFPAIVSVYGGPGSQRVRNAWELTSDLRAQRLVGQGFVVFKLDNRGTPRRGKAFETALFHRLGSVEVEDQIAGARWLAERPEIDGARIAIYGWSYGGYMAARCLLLAPDRFRAAVAGAPVTDWDGYDTHYTERYLGTPQDDRDGYTAASLLPLAPRLQRPLLIVHGMVDENVHFRHTARLLSALNAARRRYDLLVFPEERHLPRRPEDREYLERRVAEFLQQSLATP